MKYTILPVTAFILFAFTSPSSQASTHEKPTINSALIQYAGQSLDQAVQSVKSETGGRILSATTVNQNGKRIHKIKVLLPSGKVRTFKIDAS